MEGEIWDFIKKTHVLEYYYYDYKMVGILIDFIESVKKAYEMTSPLTLANRYA